MRFLLGCKLEVDDEIYTRNLAKTQPACCLLKYNSPIAYLDGNALYRGAPRRPECGKRTVGKLLSIHWLSVIYAAAAGKSDSPAV